MLYQWGLYTFVTKSTTLSPLWPWRLLWMNLLWNQPLAVTLSSDPMVLKSTILWVPLASVTLDQPCWIKSHYWNEKLIVIAGDSFISFSTKMFFLTNTISWTFIICLLFQIFLQKYSTLTQLVSADADTLSTKINEFDANHAGQVNRQIVLNSKLIHLP